LSLVVVGAQTLVTDDTGNSNPVGVGQKLSLEVAWAACPVVDACGDGVCGPDEPGNTCTTDCNPPKGCTGAERYVIFDLRSKQVLDTREGIHVSWFATGGSFDIDRTGRDGTDTTTTSDNGWTAPSQPGPVHLWVVLHDDRGGIGWAGYAFDVQ
jgi:hypothetical protein